MIPKYPFCVTVWRRVGTNKMDLRTKSFETMMAANAYASTLYHRPDVKRVQVYCILDDRNRNEMGSFESYSAEAV